MDNELNTISREEGAKLVSMGVASELTGISTQWLIKQYVNDDPTIFKPDKLNVEPRVSEKAWRRVTLNEIYRFKNRDINKG